MTENEKFLNKMRKQRRKRLLARIAKLYTPKHLRVAGIAVLAANISLAQK